MSEIHKIETENKKRALIAWLAEHCGASGNLGKTAFQKLVYAATDVCGVDTGYHFKIYTYGPFSRDLAGDLDSADRSGAISIEYIPLENKYKVEPGPSSLSVIQQNEEYIAENLPYLTWVACNLGNKSARYLELFSTLHFIVCNEQPANDDRTVDALLSLKPKFERSEVYVCLNKVKSVIGADGIIAGRGHRRLPTYSLSS